MSGPSVLRCVNVTEEAVTGRWLLPFAAREARLARLDETATGEITLAGRTLEFSAGPRAVVTVLVR